MIISSDELAKCSIPWFTMGILSLSSSNLKGSAEVKTVACSDTEVLT